MNRANAHVSNIQICVIFRLKNEGTRNLQNVAKTNESRSLWPRKWNLKVAHLPTWRKRNIWKIPGRMALARALWGTCPSSSSGSRDVDDRPRLVPPFYLSVCCLRDRFIYLFPVSLTRPSFACLWVSIWCASHTQTGCLSACQWHGVPSLPSSCFIPLVQSFTRHLPLWYHSVKDKCTRKSSLPVMVEIRWMEREMGPSWIRSFSYYFESDWWPSAGSPRPQKPLLFCRLHWMLVSQSNWGKRLSFTRLIFAFQ